MPDHHSTYVLQIRKTPFFRRAIDTPIFSLYNYHTKVINTTTSTPLDYHSRYAL